MLKRIMAFTIFFVIFFSIYGGMNYFVYTQLMNQFTLGGFIKLLIQLIFWLGGVSYVLGRLIRKFKYGFIVSYFGSIWMGILSISLFVLMIKEVLLYIINGYDYQINTIAFTLIPILSLVSITIAKKGPILKTIEIKYQKTMKNQLRIIHLSDIHLGLLTSKKWVNELVESCNGLEADLILITGDMVDDEYEKIKKFAPILKTLKAKVGVYAVSGNHEIYSGYEGFKRFCGDANIEVIDNKRIELEDITLIGVDDSSNRRGANANHQLKDLLTDSDSAKLHILLSHQPVKFREAVEAGIDLQLSGHTHRGQIPPLNFIVAIIFKYSYGVYRYKNSYIYTTSGTGTWGPPMRLFSNSELVKIEISQE
ncbi:metallophosphoesterase [Alkaliphilus serpentinus]|nr:metallophosphoesterase [Alkaliphilus serpentinus]